MHPNSLHDHLDTTVHLTDLICKTCSVRSLQRYILHNIYYVWKFFLLAFLHNRIVPLYVFLDSFGLELQEIKWIRSRISTRHVSTMCRHCRIFVVTLQTAIHVWNSLPMTAPRNRHSRVLGWGVNVG